MVYAASVSHLVSSVFMCSSTSKCKFVWGEPIFIPSKTNNSELEQYKIYLEEKINSCVSIAQSNLND